MFDVVAKVYIIFTSLVHNHVGVSLYACKQGNV